MNATYSHLVLGTAQLGMRYGIANTTGQPNYEEAKCIIKMAWDNEIRQVDTAQDYGKSEMILGEVLQDLGISNKVEVITKLKPSIDHIDERSVIKAVEKSIRTLKIQKIFGLLLHREGLIDLLDKGLEKIIEKMKKEGLIEIFGVSHYSPQIALKSLGKECVDIIQIPVNILDRRFEQAGVFKEAQKKRKKVYLRSIFLQGLLFLKSGDLPIKMTFALPVLDILDSLIKELGISRQQLALLYIREKYQGAHLIIGLETVNQLKQNLSAWNMELSDGILEKVEKAFINIDGRVINPTLWDT